ncbi:MAG: DUF4421 domain-containing protein [Prevotella sp.]|nr:DUF4421 domain-containing protein [Prevotella sp.]
MKRLLFLLLLIATSSFVFGQQDSVRIVKKNTVFRRIGKAFTHVFKEFDHIDTAYIEPQHYNYTVMLQNTNNFEMYTLKSKTGQSIMFSPEPSVRIGPYLGWRWIFLGYTFDLRHKIDDSSNTEFDVSLYSSMFNVDLYYRKTRDYRINQTFFSDDIERNVLHGTPFPGLTTSTKGFDVYYIFNHHKFSYPAAFSQSTNQRRSHGSPLVGIGFMSNNIDLNSDELKDVVESGMSKKGLEVQVDSGLMFNKVRYTSYSVSGGYAYNWVFAHNWLFAASLSVALAYQKSTGELQHDNSFSLRDFRFGNFNFDGVGRFGLVWNNTKWYAGASTIFHSYNYRKSQFSTNNVFWSLYFYFGVNICRKK